jgi:hypothetical protein
MFKKLKQEWREFKDAIKSKKCNSKSSKGDPDSRLLTVDSPVGDDKQPTALCRPRECLIHRNLHRSGAFEGLQAYAMPCLSCE